MIDAALKDPVLLHIVSEGRDFRSYSNPAP